MSSIRLQPCGQCSVLPLLLGLVGLFVACSTAVQAGDVAGANGPAAAQFEETRVPLDAPAGFVVTRFAGDDLAHDVFSLAIDPQGRVVVAGPGYIKRLVDDNGDGRADRAETISTVPKSGAHGLCFVGNALICDGDNSVLRLTDSNDDGIFDSVEKLASLRHPEHGANGIVQGPDGWFYIVCGNDSGIGQDHVTTPYSPVKDPRCGGVLRMSPDGEQMEVVAHGFRNPYDLDFGSQGQLLIVDSDGERDHHLPWYAPTRLFDVAAGREHGWLLSGWQRSWNRPQSFFDSAPRLVEFGRGSPTGAQVYRHRQFPERFRGGLFCCCWTLGRVYFCPLEEAGGTFRSQSEVFLQTTGDVGFAPVDLAVGPQGDLYVAIGGRGTAGGVFRIRFEPAESNGKVPPAKDQSPVDALSPLDEVLLADQPLASWSRAHWIPLAQRLGRDAFTAAILNHANEAAQVRAVEVLVEVFAGVPIEVVRQAIEADVPASAQARLAWALGLGHPSDEAAAALAQLTAHANHRVQRAAWESLARWGKQLCGMQDPGACLAQFAWAAGQSSRDRFVRSACATAAERVGLRPVGDSPRDRAFALRLQLERETRLPANEFFSDSMNIFVQAVGSADEVLQLEAIRLMQLALGDVRTQPGQPEVYAGYSALAADRVQDDLKAEAGRRLTPQFSSASAEVRREIARLLGMLQAETPGLLPAIAAQWTEQSSPAEDIHYLIVFSRLPGERTEELSSACAAALTSLHAKLKNRQEFASRNWPARVDEVVVELTARDARLPAALAASPRFGTFADHSLFAARMQGELADTAARKLLTAAARADEEEPFWTSELVQIVGRLSSDDAIDALRRQWFDFGLRDAITLVLAERPREIDRGKFLDALGSPQPDVVTAAARALGQLPAASNAQEFGQVVRQLRMACESEPRKAERQALAQLLAHLTGVNLAISEKPGENLLDAYRPWFDWFAKEHAAAAAELDRLSSVNAAAWEERLAQVNFDNGDLKRGLAVFQQKACHRCHQGGSRLGPDLAGAAQRFSRADLFTAIIEPSRNVAPLYRTTLITTRSGKTHLGLIVYESPDGTLLQTSPDTTVRITGDEMLQRQMSQQSLMPTGLLNDLSDQNLADLYAYLQSLKKAE